MDVEIAPEPTEEERAAILAALAEEKPAPPAQVPWLEAVAAEPAPPGL